MGDVNPFKGISPARMTCSYFFRFNTNAVNISLPKIISYTPLSDSYTTYFNLHISGKITCLRLTLNYIILFSFKFQY